MFKERITFPIVKKFRQPAGFSKLSLVAIYERERQRLAKEARKRARSAPQPARGGLNLTAETE